MKQEELDQDIFTQETPATEINVAPGEIIIGVLEGLDQQGNPLVNFTENTTNEPISAISTVAVHQNLAGRQVALLFAEANLQKPVIMGLIHSPLTQMLESFEMVDADNQTVTQTSDESTTTEVTTSDIEDVNLDGKRVVLEGKEEIVLKCGDASITLTKAGKILIRGKYLLNRSTGVNRIMGGSVQVN